MAEESKLPRANQKCQVWTPAGSLQSVNYLRLWLYIVLLCIIYTHGNGVLLGLAMPHLLYLSLNITCSQSPFLILKGRYRCITMVPNLLLHQGHAPACAAAAFRLVSSATLRNSEIEICHSHSSTVAPITYLFSHHFLWPNLNPNSQKLLTNPEKQ